MNGNQVSTALFIVTSVCGVAILPADQVSAATFVHESRSSELLVDPLNLGYNPGDGLGEASFNAPPISLTSNAIDSTQDLGFFGSLHYGPDFFDRVNAGVYSASQDYTATPLILGGDLDLSSDITISQASPLIDLSNTLEHIFTVTDDFDAILELEFSGDGTNVGSREFVRFQIQAIDAGDNNIGSPAFSLSSAIILSGGGIDAMGDSILTTVSLDAGQRYRVTATGHANSINDQGQHTSALDFALIVPEPASVSLLALGGMVLIRRRQ